MIVLCIFSSDGLTDERGQSIMFDDKRGVDNGNKLGSSHTPLDALQRTDDQCSQLLKEIENLKGKPQRRYAAQQRYNAECRSNTEKD